MAYTDIDKSDEHFDTVLRNGLNGTTDTSYSLNFQPDFLWDKSRSITGVHSLFDSVRGVGASGKVLYSHLTNAEATNGLVKSFDTNGFTIEESADNSTSVTIVDWCWKAGGTASSNTDGSITSTVSANTTSGFSIVSYTGTGSNATVGHGLSSAPKMIIFKNTNSVRDWGVYHGSLSDPDNYLTLNQTYAQTTGFNFSNNTAPTSSVFSVGTLTNNNGSSQNYIAYCFAEKKGFSKFGSYTGNGSTDGTFIYTGFKPAFFMVKQTNTTRNWNLSDNKRTNSFNVVDGNVHPNLSNAENTYDILDFVSNGVKIRNSFNDYNQSGGTYIYMAIAENPFVTSTGIPTTAR